MTRVMRRGLAGALPFAVGLVALVVAVALAQLARSGQTLDAATRDAGGAACEEAAFAACEEAAWRLGRALTDPKDPLYWYVRRELVRAHRPYLDLSGDLHPKRLEERITGADLPPLFRHMRIESFRAVWHVPKRDGPTEQLVDLECGVSLALADHRVYRRACERRRYGVVHVAPPKPFDQLTLAIADHGFLRRLPALRAGRASMLFASNALSERIDWMRRAVWDPAAGPAPEAPEGMASLSGEVSGADRVTLAFAPPFLMTRHAPAMPPQLRQALAEVLAQRRATDRATDDALGRMTPQERAWEEWRLVGAHRAGQVRIEVTRQTLPDVTRVWPPLPPSLVRRDAPLPDQVVFSMEPEVDLAEFDYEARLKAREEELFPRVEAVAERVNDQWVRWMGESATRVGAKELRQLVEQLTTSSEQVRPGIEKLIEELEKLVTHAAAHTRGGFAAGALDAYLTRASKRLRAFGLHVDDQRDLEAALADYPVFNGHLSTAGKHPLVLKAPRLAGKMVISARPAPAILSAPTLTIEELTRTDPAIDLIVVDAPRIDITADRVEAAIVAGDRLAFRSPGTRIAGNLVMRRLRPLADRAADEMLRGTVVWDPQVSSGPVLERLDTADEPEGLALDHYVVTLCPRDLKRVTKRTPPQEPK